MDEQQKDTVHSKEFYKKLTEDITTGKTSKLLENSKESLFLLVQSVKDGEQLLNLAVKNLQKNK